MVTRLVPTKARVVLKALLGVPPPYLAYLGIGANLAAVLITLNFRDA